MIVVDTNVVAYLFIPGDRTSDAERVLKTDADWAVPVFWISEFRNVLALYVRKKLLSLADAQLICEKAESLLVDREFEVASPDVLNLVSTSGLAAYDCEFVSLAQDLGVPLVTSDQKVLKAFPATAVAMEVFAP